MPDSINLLDKIRKVFQEEIATALKPINKQLVEQGQLLLEHGQALEKIKKVQHEHGEALEEVGKIQREHVEKICLLLSGQAHIETTIKALATKQDVERLEKEVDQIKKSLKPRRAD